jgi:peptidoglycan/xylan/chitin deacetylase (PgdA/CDA1 family)
MAMLARYKGNGVIINFHTLDSEEMKLHLEVLSRWFEFIDLNGLPSRLAGRRSKPFCLLTFDDGKLSNATQAAPVLHSLGVPAVFYVVTGNTTSGSPLWFDRYAALLRALTRPPCGLEPHLVRKLPLALLEERLDLACAQYGVEPDLSCEHVQLMSWQQVRNLARDGFTIGAHGVRHAILTNEPPKAAKAEIERSLTQVAQETGATCSTFAFPNGNYTADLARHVLHLHARTAVTTEPTWVSSRTPLWRLPRVQLSGAFSPERIELKLAVAAAGKLLRNPDGSGRAYARTSKPASRDA